MSKIAKFVGLDVHKDTIAMAVADGGPLQRACFVGTLKHDVRPLIRMLCRLGDPADVHVVYEAGPTGFGLCRRLQESGFPCQVIAPSKTPRKPGDHVKTDRRDAITLADGLRMNALTPIVLPEVEHEALRDLIRCREDAKHAQRAARQQLAMFLLRHGRTYAGKTTWNQMHVDWIRSQRFESEAQQLVLQDCLHEALRVHERVDSLERSVDEHALKLKTKRLYQRYMALRGVRSIVAATLVAELGDLRRFPNAPALMSFVGLVPCESSSGDRTSRGPITKAGNKLVRCMLVEAAQANRRRPSNSRALLARQKDLPEEVCAIAWKAQKRLFKLYARMSARSKKTNVTIVAMARELCGFVWAIGQVAPA